MQTCALAKNSTLGKRVLLSNHTDLVHDADRPAPACGAHPFLIHTTQLLQCQLSFLALHLPALSTPIRHPLCVCLPNLYHQKPRHPSGALVALACQRLTSLGALIPTHPSPRHPPTQVPQADRHRVLFDLPWLHRRVAPLSREEAVVPQVLPRLHEVYHRRFRG